MQKKNHHPLAPYQGIRLTETIRGYEYCSARCPECGNTWNVLNSDGKSKIRTHTKEGRLLPWEAERRMVNCEKLKAIVPENTCIARQKKIQRGKPWEGRAEMVLSCQGCKIGEKLLKEGGTNMEEKKCVKCGNTFPATLVHFDPAPGAADKLTIKCKVCRSKETGVTLSPPPAMKPKKTKNHKVPTSQERTKLYIDISAVPGLYAALKKRADGEMRTPLAQALWILKEELT